jgi:class 3 adenylate cyclase
VICACCGGENAAFVPVCRHCAARLGLVCLACGVENPAEANFCCGCAARLEEVQSEDTRGERRQLTVLFCDMVGSTELSQRLDPEDLADLLGTYQRVCSDAVHAHEGHIAQYRGDGVLVYFGYPRSHEDEAQRAVRCGLDILESVRALRAGGRIRPDTPLEVRLGAHTGRVVVGPVGAGDRHDRIALGDTPNIAARVQGEAEIGTLTVSDATWRICEGYFTGTCLGERRLKGVSEQVRLWRVTGESASSERIEVAGMLTPFVGRDAEQAILRRAWSDSQAGQSRFVLLRGDAGMGKSRLAQLFRDEVRLSARETLMMRATPYNSRSPFHPVIDLIERLFAAERTLAPAERLRRLEAGLRGLGLTEPEAVVLLASLLSIPGGDRYAPLRLSPARQRGRTMSLLVRLVGAIARTGPTLLIVEDLHWIDSSTVELLGELITAAPRVPLLGVLTARPEFDLPSTASTSSFQIVELSKFERIEAEAVARGTASGKALPGDVLRQILARSDGVPLFVEELTHSVLDSGVLSERAASWEVVGLVSAEAIPATVDASLTSRIDRLGSSRATAQLAATIGREFTFALLRQVSERDEATLSQDLDRLLRSGLAWPSSQGADTFLFKHALIRDAAYNSLLRTTRQSYHSRIAATLRERFAEQAAARPDLVAHHLTSAAEHESAFAFWKAAGDQALARAAVREAAEHFQRAIDCLGHLPVTLERRERELELQIVLAPLLMAVHGWGAVEVEQACERGLALAHELGRADLRYGPLWGLWSVRFLRGEMAPAREAAELVLQLSQASGVPMLEITGRHATAYTRVYRGEFTRALEEAEAGLPLCDLEQDRTLADTFGLSPSVCLRTTRGHALWMLGRVVEAEEEWSAMLRYARDLQHPPSLAAALAFTLHGGAFRHSYLGQMERLVDVADELMALSMEADFFFWHPVAYTYRGCIAQAMGETVKARTQMVEGLELFTQTGSRLSLVMMNVVCAEALHRLGDDDTALRWLELAEAEMHARAEGLMAPEIWRVRGRLQASRGERSAAEASYRLAMERAREQRALSLELRAALDLHDLCAGEARTGECRASLARLLEGFSQGLDRPEPARAVSIVRGSPPASFVPSRR